MRITVNHATDTPIYQQIVDSVARDIRSGVLSAGFQLPTVRLLAEECGASQGTVKHAYDTLEQLGLIEKTQGRGTFVCDTGRGRPAGKKEQALEAIDSLLDQLQELEFPLRDVRIFLDLKLREREQVFSNVRVAAVDCSPEALSVMCRQISALPHVDVYEYLLQSVLDAPARFNPGLDMVVTTPTHYGQLSEKMEPDKEPVRLVMAIATPTVMELARIPENTRVGILTASERFSGVILRTCEQYCTLDVSPVMAYLGDPAATEAFLARIDLLILPPQYLQFCTRAEQAVIKQYIENHPYIVYQYQIEQGSLLYLEEQIFKVYQNSRNKL